MKRIALLVFKFLLIQIVFSGQLAGQITGFNKIKWESERIAPGLTWKSSHTFINDTTPQNYNVLLINLRKRKVSLVYNPEKNIFLSEQALESGAIAAVNAGFFNIRDGGSATYIRTDGLIKEIDTAKVWSRNENMTGSVLINSEGEVFINKSFTNNWYDTHPEFKYVLVTGPLLLSGNERLQLPQTPLVVNKHPRTVAGKKGNHRLVILTIDGRTDQAAGMTLNEVAELMLLFKCTDAINLDGGGSTTMWISGKPFNGVVNMPSDNKKFDNEGERAVSDIIIIK